jgi:hypothetical protein
MNESDMNKSSGSNDGKATSGWSLLPDLYVDLLGSLVPGLLTVIIGGSAFFLVMSAGYVALYKKPLFESGFPAGIKEILASLHWELAAIVLVSAYIIGAVLFRQDTKRPDSSSASYVWKSSNRDDRKGLAVQHIETSKMDTQFPYLYVRCYLKARGLEHLMHLIPWCPTLPQTHGRRSKMFMNIIKIRLHAYFPSASQQIVRNEGHVRLATSVWYASKTLVYLSVFLTLIIVPVSWGCILYKMTSTLFAPCIAILLLWLFCIGMLFHLRKCIHYMRVREVVYVLENAHLADQLTGKNLFADLIKGQEIIDCANCDRMKQDEMVKSRKNSSEGKSNG